MDRERALHIAVTAIVREILGGNAPSYSGSPTGNTLPDDDPNPRPQFDFDESTCVHGDLVIDRSVCPVHGPQSMGPPPTPEMLDDIVNETQEEANPLIARAERKRRQREEAQKNAALYPEEIPMSGLVGRPPDDPPLVV